MAANVAFGVPMASSAISRPSCDTVPQARMSLASTWRSAPTAPHTIVTRPNDNPRGFHTLGVLERRGDHGDEDHARFDHGGGVQVGADRGRRRHGPGQPDVERELRRLGRRCDEDQDRRRIGGRAGDRGDLTETGGAGGIDEQHEAREERQATGGGDDERTTRRDASNRVDVLETDEEERRDRGEFPEDEQRPDGIGPDEPDHGGREGEERGGEAAHARRAGREIPDGIDAHERTDAGDQRREQRSHGVDPEFDGNVEAGHPLEPCGDDVGRSQPCCGPQGGDRHRHGSHPE